MNHQWDIAAGGILAVLLDYKSNRYYFGMNSKRGLIKLTGGSDPDGHASPKEAIDNYIEYLLEISTVYTAKLVTQDNIQKCALDECMAWTSGGAIIDDGTFRAIRPLCQKHRTEPILRQNLRLSFKRHFPQDYQF